jgi:acetoin utilization deacetylase AcuC-like enzyme
MYAVGYAYDPIFLAHTLRHHPENHTRLEAVMGLLRSKGELDRLVPLTLQPASEEILGRVHDQVYVRELKAVSARGGGALNPDTYVARASFEAAAMAAGASMSAVEAVLRGEVRRAFALVRPPGHHAFADHGEGFCLFNNAAFAAKRALGDLAQPGAAQERDVKRVMIVDWDVHHGNGTQAIFYEDPRVLYVSVHQAPLYPHSGRISETGRGAGQGTTVNVPLPVGAGDAGYARVFDEIVVPAARRYQPELLLMSAGYDAHWVDLLAGMAVSLQGFARMAAGLSRLSEELCGGCIVAVLEGGYDLDVLSYGVLNTFSALRGDDTVLDPLGPYAGRETPVEEVVQRVKQVHGL